MNIPKVRDLYEPLFQAICELGGSASIREQEDKVATLLKLTDEQLSIAHTRHSTEFSYRLGWARTNLKKYGILSNSSRGVWALTPAGRTKRSITADEVQRFIKERFIKAKTDSRPSSQDADTAATEQWSDRVLELIMSSPPDAFERLCKRILRESGFTSVEVTGKIADGGIDGQGVLRLGGLLSFNVRFQCKRHKGSVSSSVVRDFRGALQGRADKGILLTTSTFTREARKEAQRDGAIMIDLVDGEELAEKLRELRIGIEVREQVIIDEDYFRNL